jgi:hypothetical protein
MACSIAVRCSGAALLLPALLALRLQAPPPNR